MTWEASGEVLFSGLKLVPNSASTKIRWPSVRAQTICGES